VYIQQQKIEFIDHPQSALAYNFASFVLLHFTSYCSDTYNVSLAMWHEFCCKFLGEYDSEKNSENQPTFVEVMNECIIARFFLTHFVH